MNVVTGRQTGVTTRTATDNFLHATSQLFGQPPFTSDRGVRAWSLPFYGEGRSMGMYRTTLFVDASGDYTHLVMSPDGEMEVQQSGVHDAHDGRVSPSLFAEHVVGLVGGSFRYLRLAHGPDASEPLVDVLARALDMLRDGTPPPVLDFQQHIA